MWYLIIGCSVLCLGVCLPMYRCNFKKHRIFATVFKSLGTLCAMAIALVAAVKLDSRAYACAGAILLCAISDFVINCNLLAGIVSFSLSHFGIIAWLLIMNPLASPVISVMHIICFVGFCLISVLIIISQRKLIDKKLIPAICIYSVLLSAMAACAVAGGVRLHSLAGILCAVGGGLFYISDVMVMRTIFSPHNETLEVVLMILYYCAQLLFGSSCLLMYSIPVL